MSEKISFGFISNEERDAKLPEKRKIVQGYLSEGFNTIQSNKSDQPYTDIGQMTDSQVWKAADLISGKSKQEQGNLSDEQMDKIIDTDISGLVPLGGGGSSSQIPLEKRLDKIYKRLGQYSSYCDKAAKQAQRQFVKDGIFAEIVEISDVNGARYIFSSEGKVLGTSGFHQAVKVGEKYFDAMTGSQGATLAEYLKFFDPAHVLKIVPK